MDYVDLIAYAVEYAKKNTTNYVKEQLQLYFCLHYCDY